MAPIIPEKIKDVRKLSIKSLIDKILVIDNENSLSNNEISGDDGYYADSKQKTLDDVKFKHKRKIRTQSYCLDSNLIGLHVKTLYPRISVCNQFKSLY